jgi:hypothetical protein
MEGDSSDDESDRFLPDDAVENAQGIEDISWIPLVPGVTVSTSRQPRIVKTWTEFQHNAAGEHDPYADTTAVRVGCRCRTCGA